MPLSAGTTLGAYEVVALIGAGGMGEVYRARDTRLKRDVAIKVLPDAFANDPERLARFQREAELLATLNHPNIAQIHGVEQNALVLELVEGPTLADRIAQGPIPIHEALPIARQIAEALESAHDRGVIHRDLKPANIKITADDRVKVLDFGLAKALDPDHGPAKVDLSHSPTLSLMGTQAGVVLGTAAYMSPEQAKGLPADHRSDIFAFGVVLYEMLTGRQPFSGATAPELLAAVMVRDADLEALPSHLNPRLTDMLRRCLAKDPKGRWQAIGDVRVELDVIGQNPLVRPENTWRRTYASAAIAACVLASTAAFFAGRLSRSDRPALTHVKLRIAPAAMATSTISNSIAISADGRRLAYTAIENGIQRIYTHTLDRPDPAPIAETQNAIGPFFSPDGLWVAFHRGSTIEKALIAGGTPQPIATTPGFIRGATWTKDGTIIFSAGDPSRLYRVSADGGQPVQLPATRSTAWYRWPSVLDADTLLVTLGGSNGTLATMSLRTGETRDVLPTPSPAQYLPSGHILYLNGGQLWAVLFDVKSHKTTGEPKLVVDRVASVPAPVAVSGTGTLLYLAPSDGNDDASTVGWIAPPDAMKPLELPPGRWGDLALSPDGSRLLMASRSVSTPADVWVHEVDRRITRKLTFDAGEEETPVWSPDGSQIAFSASRVGERRTVYVKNLQNSEERAVWTSEQHSHVYGWSADGRYLVASMGSPQTSSDIWRVRVDGGGAEPIVNTRFSEAQPSLSPDGRWLAYQSDESGQAEVYVQPFLIRGPKVQVSVAGGEQPRWSTDGKRLVYRRGGKFYAASVAAQANIAIGRPVELAIDPSAQPGHFNYDIAADGRLIVAVLQSMSAGQPALLFNLPEAIRQTFASAK